MKNLRWHVPLLGAVALALALSLNAAAAAEERPAAAGGGAAAAAEGAPVEDVPVARVNGVAIPRAALVRMMGRMQSRGTAADAAHADTQLKAQALRRLILQELAYQEAQSRGIAVGAAEVDAAVERIRSGNAAGPAGFAAFLEKEALTEAGLRSLVERNLVLEAIIKKEVVEKSQVAEKDLRAAYERSKGALTTPERLAATEILFLLDPAAADSRRRAGALLQGLRDNPARAPRELEPDGTFIVRELQIKPDDDPVLYAAAKKLKPGEISGVIASQQSLHIIQLNEYVPARQPTFEEARGALERELAARAQQRRLEAWEAELRARAKIETPGDGDGGR
jgi:parvulin-like peptidyl-prolyl isomerase